VTTQRIRPVRLLFLLAAVAATVGPLAGCGSDSDGEAAAASDAPLATEVPAGTKLTIADDANKLAALMRLSGEQDKLAAEVGYANFTSGPLRLEAIRAGRAQIAAVGDVPPILAQFSDAGVPIVGAIRRTGGGDRLATSPESGIARLEDLRGKKVAINEGTAQQAIALRNLKAAGLSLDDIEPVALDLAEFVDALRTNQVDAAVVKQPDRSRYLADHASAGARALDNAPGANPGLFYLSASTKALGDEALAAAVRDFVVHWYRAQQWLNENKDVWEREYLIGDQKIPPEDAGAITESDGSAEFPKLDALIATQQETVDILQEAGAFPGKKLDARGQFDLRFDGLTAEAPLSGR
jgi:sulfonate transport system substrate-binding protein